MLTPNEIVNVKFKKSFRGYEELEVDSFLDRIAEEYAELYLSYTQLQKKINELTLELDRQPAKENWTINNSGTALREAEEIRALAIKEVEEIRAAVNKEADEIKDEANKRAEIIVREAELQAGEIQNETAARVRLSEENLALNNSANVIKEAEEIKANAIIEAEEIKAVAAKEAEFIIKEAEIQSKETHEKVVTRIRLLNTEYESVRRQVKVYSAS